MVTYHFDMRIMCSRVNEKDLFLLESAGELRIINSLYLRRKNRVPPLPPTIINEKDLGWCPVGWCLHQYICYLDARVNVLCIKCY